MYHAHFGLKRPLFDGGIAQDQSVFRSAKHDQLVERFKLALASPCSVITLTGPPGIGKTTLTSAALRATQTRLALAWLNGLVTNGTELLELLLVELGLVAERTTRVERLQLWRQFHSEMGATESRVFVIAERADDLSVEVLRALDGLTAPDATGYTGANLILLGQAGLERHLEAPALESLRQRIRLRARLEPFTEPELQDYLRHQAACAGGDYDHLFAPGTNAALFRHSGGVARLANHLCETALTIAAGEAQKLLTPQIVQRVATTILGLNTANTPNAGTAVTAAPTPVAAVSFAPVSLTAVSFAAAPTVPLAPTTPVPTGVAVAPTAPPAPVSGTPAAAVTSPPSPSPPAPARPAPATASSVATVTPGPAGGSLASTPAESRAAEFEFDGEATEVPDVSIMDFPVLTDAVDDGPVLSAPRTTVPPSAPKPVTPPLAAPLARTAPPVAAPPPAAPASSPSPAAAAPLGRPTAATPPARPTPPPVAAPAPRRIETAYATAKPAAPAKPGTPPLAAPTPPAKTVDAKPAPPPAPVASHDPEADDVLRQTQTMRAISVAKSIDDISSSMAETLFGEADLDILSAALAASIDESGETQAPAPPPARPASTAPGPHKAPVATSDDLLDLLDLTSDATLELMDDPHDTPTADGRKTANQR